MSTKFDNVLGFGAEPMAIFAVNPKSSRGRFYKESDSPTRTPFQRDRDRIIHSTAFRRLKHKTQVFVYHEGDHFRTRLTHTIEVAQIARSLARALCLDEDLSEALALAHDLGHPPFGHEGENVLDDCLVDFGGFDHNAQSFRVVTHLERRYAEFDGLNLTWETLEGLVKHNGPLVDESGSPIGVHKGKKLPFGITDYDLHGELNLSTWPSAEAQAAALADDIAYNSHDLDDGLRAGLFDIDDLKTIPLVDEIIHEVDGKYPNLDMNRRINEVVRRVIIRFVEDVIQESMARINKLDPKCVEEIRQSKIPCIQFSEDMSKCESQIKSFLNERMYRHNEVLQVRDAVSQIVRDLFAKYLDKVDEMSEEWQIDLEHGDSFTRARRVADYIAGMTDRYAVEEHRRMFKETPILRKAQQTGLSSPHSIVNFGE